MIRRPDASIGRKLTVAFAIIAVLVAALGVAVILNAARVATLQEQQTTLMGPRAEAADALAFALLRVAVAMRSFALTAAPDDATRTRLAVTDTEAAIAALSRLSASAEGQVLFEDVEARVRRYLGDVTALVEGISREGWTPSLVEPERALARQRSDLVEVVQRYADLQRRSMHGTRQRIQSAVDGLVTTAGIVTAVVLVGSIVTAFILARGIRRPAGRLRDAAVAIIDGDFGPAMALDEHRSAAGEFADVRRFRDEIRDAANVFGRMAKVVKEREERLQAQAEELQAQNEELHSQADVLRARQDELERVNHQLRAAEREKDHFLAVLGHELRNPLAAIRTASALAAREPSSRTAEAQAVITRQAAHLARLVDDLLDVARITRGKLTLTRRPLDLAELVRRCVAQLRMTGGLQDRVVSMVVSAVWVDADETRLEQVIANLLGNAGKFTAPGGHVRVFVGGEHGQAVLRIADDGVGMDAPLIARIFDMFVQGNGAPASGFGGLGIGLTLCRQLVALHGGTIEAVSDGPGRGSTFTARLPAIEPPTPTERVERGSMAPRRQRIVVIEDNEDGREMMRTWLEASGHEVHTAGDGIAGVELVRAVDPDVALVDLGLPGCDGFEVARRLRARGSTRTLLIALTGYGQAEDARRATEAGFAMHLVKPVDPDQLIAIIDTRALERDGDIPAPPPAATSPDRAREPETPHR